MEWVFTAPKNGIGESMSTVTVILTDTSLTQWNGAITDGTDIPVECFGGGAGGPKSGGAYNGGGGAGYARSVVSYISGSTVPIQIGVGGIGATSEGPGTDGSDTIWNINQIIARAGKSIGDPGGADPTNIGDVENLGGFGEFWSHRDNAAAGGGAGGCSAGGGAGGALAPSAGGMGGGGSISGTPGIASGGGGDGSTTLKQNGVFPGGGGGGCLSGTAGDGAKGCIVITYTVDLRKKIVFTNGSNSVVVDVPTWPYSCEIIMPISSIKDSQGSPTFFDPPASHGDDTLGTWDYRLLNTATWRIPAAQQITLSAFFKDATKGRGENVTMTLQSGSGFFPFGPDLGDSGDFVVRLLSIDQSGRLGRPWNYFENAIQIVLVTPPGGYSLPTQYNEGSLSIGSVSGLQFVDYASKTYRNIQHQLTASGVPYAIDGRTSGDSYEVGFTQLCNQGNAAALAALLVSTSGRSADITIVAPANFYLFGADNASAGTYTAKFLGASPNDKTVSIKMTNERFNQWSFPLTFWLKAVV